ncbi:hypothetical protein AKO1_007820 [Acrasis kona]|uniref:Uncharacterized protein n=1 Tax=Acrasis kona TaxID=1008807 RepID=A0AAW2YN62_9EUKA
MLRITNKEKPIDGARECLLRIINAKAPYLLVTNGSGETEKERSQRLSNLFNLDITEDHIVLAHTPIKDLAPEYGNKRILVIGRNKDKISRLMTSYGFNNFEFIDDYVDEHAYLSPYTHRHHPNASASFDTSNEIPIEAVFILENPDKWQSTLQVLVDVMLSDGRVGILRQPNQKQILLCNANPDLVYGGKYIHPRFTSGAFIKCLEELYKSVSYNNHEVVVTQYGKPFESTYKYATSMLENQSKALSRIYAVGDNPKSDIAGANAAGPLWHSILVRTGIFRIGENDNQHPAKKVCNSIVDATEFMFTQ